MAAGVALVLIAGGILTAMAGAAGTHRTILISRATGTHGAKENTSASQSAISASGRYVAFTSDATNLSPADHVLDKDVYVRDRVAHRTILVSRRNGTHGAKGNDSSYEPSISADGRFIAFRSLATNLSPSDPSPNPDIYVRDLKRHRTILVSRASGLHGAPSDSDSYRPSISADGRRIAFESYADNLSSADTNSGEDIYVRDLRTHKTIYASRRSGRHGGGGNTDSFTTAISGNGRFVAFQSNSDNLSSADNSGDTDIYARDLKRHRTILVSRRSGAGGAKGDGYSYAPSVSADGHRVAFHTTSANLSAADPSADYDVYVRDLPGHRTTLVSRQGGAHGDVGSSDSADPSISANGRFVAFDSNADNLSPADTDNDPDIYVRDLRRHRTTLASRRSGTHGGKANGSSGEPVISANALAVAFTSSATNLSSADPSNGSDIYLRTGPF